MPPAVEPGLPPMNMSMTVSSFEASESAAVSHAVEASRPRRHGGEKAHEYLLAEGHVRVHAVSLYEEEEQRPAQNQRERHDEDQLGLEVISPPVQALLPHVVPDEEAQAAQDYEQHYGDADERVVRIRYQGRKRRLHSHEVKAGVAEG